MNPFANQIADYESVIRWMYNRIEKQKTQVEKWKKDSDDYELLELEFIYISNNEPTDGV